MTEAIRPVVLATNTLHGGGAERVVLDLARNWPLVNAPAIILLAERRGELLAEVPDGIEVVEVGVPLSTSRSAAFLKALRQILVARPPAAVISHLTPMNRMLLRARIAGVFAAPMTVVEHNNPDLNIEGSGPLGAIARCETGLLYRHADRLVCVSEGLLHGVRNRYRLPQSFGQVINNPIDINAIRQYSTVRPNDRLSDQLNALPRPLLLGAGRLHRQKDFATMIRAFASLPRRYRGSLVIIGDGDERSKLEALVAELGLIGHVHLPGFVKNPWWYMAQADLFLLSSRWEGFGNVLVEALVSGTAILATDCPYGPSEIINRLSSGLLVPVGAPAEMAEGIVRMLNGAEESRLPSQCAFDSLNPAQVAAMYADVALPDLLSGPRTTISRAKEN